MADISKLSRLVAGIHRQVDLQQNSLIVGSLKVGTSTPTELTQALLDSLLAIRTDLASTASGKGASLIGIQDAGNIITATTVEGALAETKGVADSALSTANAAIPATQKGAANGVASLDSGGKVPVAQLPNSILEYIGTWDASTNTPTLSDYASGAAAGTHIGDVYRVSVAGTQNLGSGAITFVVGDYAIINNLGKFEKSHSGADAVTSVNGFAGVVVLTTNDVAESVNLYYTQARFDSAFGAKSTTNLAEGSNLYYTSARFDSAFTAKSTTNLSEGSNLYFTTGRAQTAAVVNSTAGSETTQAPSVSATKAYVSSAIGAIVTDSLSRSMPAGEALAASTLYAVRLGRPANSETAGRVYKADNDATTLDNFHVVGLCLIGGSPISAGGTVTAYKVGKMTVTGHGFTVGQPIWLGASGALTSTAPSAAGSADVIVGIAEDANTIDVRIQIMGVN